MTSYLRPDEKATQSEIRKAQRRTGEVTSGLKTAASLGGASLGGKLVSKVLPFLSEYIPEDLAHKGINKVAPSLGNFLKNGMKQGLSLKSGLDFLKSQFSNQPQENPYDSMLGQLKGMQGQLDALGTEGNQGGPPKQNKNIIEQESPELHQFILDQVRNGRAPIEAAAIAQNDKRFGGVIKDLVKRHKTPWSSIIEGVFGAGERALPQQEQQQPQQQQAGNPQAKQQLMQAMQALSQQLKS